MWGVETVADNTFDQPGIETGRIQPADIFLLGDAILVRIDPPDEVTRSKRLHIPETAQTQHGCYAGTVLGIGPGKLSLKTGEPIPNSVKAGDRVLFAWNGRELAKIRKGIDIIRDTDIYAVLEQTKGAKASCLNNVSATRKPR